LLLLEEDRVTPSVAFGIDDVVGTGLFKSKYLAASKQFGALDTTLGVGEGRISGVFAGARYAPATWNGIALAAEYDANNYKQDFGSKQTGVYQRQQRRRPGCGISPRLAGFATFVIAPASPASTSMSLFR